jgi:exosortase
MATDTTLPAESGVSASDPAATKPVPMTVPAPATPAAPAAPTATIWLGVLVGAVIALAFAPLLQAHAQNLWSRPHYQFFPLAILGSLALAWSYGRSGLALRTPGSTNVTLAGLALAWVLLAVAEVFFSPVLAAAALLVLLGALIHGAGGTALWRTLLPAWAFLWLLVPPPFGLDRRLVLMLQGLTSRWSSAVLDTLGVLHLPDGNVVTLGERRLLVEEACAGISSLIALIACTLFLVLWQRRPWPRALALLAAAVGWVLVCNSLRVVIIAYAFDRWGLDLSLGLKHELLGLGCFLLAVLLIWSTDRLGLFLVPRAADPSAPPPESPPPSAAPALDAFTAAVRLLSWPTAVAFGLLFALHTATYGLTPDGGPGDLLPAIARLDRDTLPEELAGWKRERYYTEERETGSAYGEHSRVWAYKLGQRTALVAIDYPFAKFHMLDECYVNQGWALARHTDYHGDEAERTPAVWVELSLQKAALRTGSVFYCESNHSGTFLEPDPGPVRGALQRYERALTAWRQRLAHPDEAGRLEERGPTYQFQVFIEGNRPLTAEEQQAVRLLFFEAVHALRKELYPAS